MVLESLVITDKGLVGGGGSSIIYQSVLGD